MKPHVSILRRAAVAGLALGLAACDEPLAVNNRNNPDVARVFATPTGVETVVSKSFQQAYGGMYNTSNSIWPALAVMAFESGSQLGNFGMGTQSAIPRAPWDNQRGNREEVEHFRVYDFESRNARMATNAIAALDTFRVRNLSTGVPMRDARAKSFAYFTRGFALANLALFYDSAGVPATDTVLRAAPVYVPALQGAHDVMEEALASFDSAIAAATTPGITGFEIPADWVASPSSAWSRDRYIQVIRSFKARYRANVARTPEEREAVDWDAVIADATAGITTDLMINLSTQTGWQLNWNSQAAVQGWHQMPYMIIGMADTTGAYDAWLAQGLNDRQPFLIRTPDRRFPSGETRAAQQAKAATKYPSDTIVFFRNRPTGEDTPAWAFATSQYDYFRFWGYTQVNFLNYPWPIITRAEVDLLAAEGHIRNGNLAAAATLIDRYRTENGLPATAGSPAAVSLANPVPGGSACVPRVPVGPSFTTTVCGNLMEALKWEKRMETAFTGFGQWFLDSRGWGDLAEATPLDLPVPYQEMDARAQPFYNSQNHAAGKGTYGY